MKHNATRDLSLCAMVAALYGILTMALPVLSYSAVQLRFAEALAVLPWLFPQAVPGLGLGCAVANLGSAFGPADVLCGSLATLLAALWTSRVPRRWMAPIPPVLCNSLIIGAELAWFEAGFGPGFSAAFALNALTVALGEAAACCLLGPVLLKQLPRIEFFRRFIPPDRLDRLDSL